MNLIQINKGVFINPDKIDSVEVGSLHGKNVLSIYVNGKRYTTLLTQEQLFSLISKKQVDVPYQYFSL